MKTIICKFKSNGNNIAKTAILSNDLKTISKSKHNQALDIVYEENYDLDTWCIVFPGMNSVYECHFKVIDNVRTLNPVKAVTWIGRDLDVCDDTQALTVNIK